MKFEWQLNRWPLRAPFVTAQERITEIVTLTVLLESDGFKGRGEALGVDYLGETIDSITVQLEAVRDPIESGLTRARLQQLLPVGGARNALDCALWDLASKRAGQRAWTLAGQRCEPVTTVYTLALDEPARMAAAALAHAQFGVLKLKLDGDDPAARMAAVRRARPDARLVIDVNGGWNETLLDQLTGSLVEHRIDLLEQPLPRGADSALQGARFPIPLCADESCQGLQDLPYAAQHYSHINIKLDKCGGLTEALAMVAWCQQRRLGLMVGNMLGSSLAMAPAMLVAQHCQFVDLDGPLWQATDRASPLAFNKGVVAPPEEKLWG